MCGFFGVLGRVDSKKAQEAFFSLAHRGPDDYKILEHKNYFLAHHRLAITDKSQDSRQPFVKEGVMLLFNGEIYNYKALKKELKGYDFKTQSDTEVVMAAYLAWGESFATKLKGMFALALIDHDKTLLARDLLGKKPLYYRINDEALSFASELKALRVYKKEPLKMAFVSQYLRFQTALAPHTAYSHIYALNPGELLIFKKSKLTKTFYHDITAPLCRDSFKTAVIKVESLLLEAVSNRLEDIKEPKILLSGGLDSALLVALASKLSKETIKTYTVGYEEYVRYDESHWANEVAKRFKTEHKRVLYTKADFKADIEDVSHRLDEPLNDPAALPLFKLYETIAKEATEPVVLSGEGSDELFLGYRTYREFLDMEHLKQLKKKSWLKNYFKAHPSEHREWYWFSRIFNEELLFQSSAESFQAKQIKQMLHKRFWHQDTKRIEAHYERFSQSVKRKDATLWYRYIDLKVLQADYFLKKVDRISMAHGIEARTPYLDQNVVSYVMGLPSKHLLKSFEPKALLKAVAQSYLPDEIIYRKKRGFSYPFNEWMQELELFAQMQELNKELNVFKSKALDKLILGASKGAFKQHVFGVYALLMWLKNQ